MFLRYKRIILNNSRLLWLSAIIISYVVFTTFLVSCANSSVALTGGLKDTIAPVLLRTYPEQKRTNFGEKELIFTFNEYVQIRNQNKNFVISPPLPDNKKAELKVKGKNVVVKLPSVAENTTYYVDFGASIVDVNEGNPAEYMNFTFSTGANLDTMVYVGFVHDAYTLNPVENASVFLYDEDIDSVVYNRNPSALSITNKEGVYVIKGLKNKNYKLVAVTDQNANFRYDQGSEKIAFSNNLITPVFFSNDDSIAFDELPKLNMFEENAKRQALSEYKRPEARMLHLRFNEIYPEIKSFTMDGVSSGQYIEEKSLKGDTVNYWLTARNVSDTINATLVFMKQDSINMFVPDTVKLRFIAPNLQKRKQKDSDEEEIIPVLPVINAVPTSVVEKDVTFNFKTPLQRADASKIFLYKMDNADTVKIPINSFTKDSIKLTNYTLSANWETNSKYELIILPDAFVDIYSFANDSISKNFETADPEKYGSITVEVTNSDKQHVFQLMKDKNIVQQKIVSGSEKVVFRYLGDGNYRIRVIEDLNENGRWDTGKYMEKQQPERVMFVVFSNGDDFLEVKSNWEHEQTIDISELFSN